MIYRPIGIGVLMSSFSTVRSQGGALKLVNLSKRSLSGARLPSNFPSQEHRS